ncbi:hypothetical protein GOV11_04470 [Candidatus Woesearchaeota archaeon]|nr:hypothetical protein [Candidatus Woesearchaeota archaeon]
MQSTYTFEKTNARMPVKSFRSGAINVAIWENTSTVKDGQQATFYTISLERRYKDRDDTWKSTPSLRVNDLPKATLILQKAYEYLVLTSTEEELN